MGTAIELTVCKVSLDYSKNHMGNDYGFLFQDEDESNCASDAIDYEYYKEHPEEELAEHEAAFTRPLAKAIPILINSDSSAPRRGTEFPNED